MTIPALALSNLLGQVDGCVTDFSICFAVLHTCFFFLAGGSSRYDERRKDMNSLSVQLFAFLFLTGIVHLSAFQLPPKVQPKPETANNRFVRQTETTTTTPPKPKKPRPSNIFGLISVLLTETRDDASRAFNEIGTLFNGQFANATTTTTTTKKPDSGTSTTSAPSESDEDNEITTTTEAFRITREEFLGILRSNVEGIRNLFGKEFRVAIRDSNQNVREFGRGLGDALRPYFNNNN